MVGIIPIWTKIYVNFRDSHLPAIFSLIHLENLVDQIGTDHPFDTITELIEEVLGNDFLLSFKKSEIMGKEE